MTKNRLHGFIEAARRRVAAGAYACTGQPRPSNGSLRAALTGPAVIAELKPRSPSEGRLLHRPATEVLAAYRAGGAPALSVLTDADHFDGDPALLDAAHATGLPVLMKDFIVDEAQLDCAAHHGASAVLLIERCLGPRREALVEAAHARGLEVLLEVHGPEEAAAVADSQADLVGVNARDLDTLDVDAPGALDVMRSLAGRPVVALSGIRDRHDRLVAQAAGAGAVLVGTHLMRAPDPALWLTALRRPLAKVCGLTRAEDVDAAAAAGADLAGFVVGATSPRSIPAIQAQRLADQARALGLRPVLVTPHEDAWEVREWCRLVRPDFVQLTRLRPDDEWIHSLQNIPVTPLHVVHDEVPESGGLVVDTPGPESGGTGRPHDWAATGRLLAAHRGRFSLVAGGLAADNAAQALAASGAWGADASSRLESVPGCKDPEAVAAFVAAVQEA